MDSMPPVTPSRTRRMIAPVVSGAIAFGALAAAFGAGHVLGPAVSQAQQIRTQPPQAAAALPSFADIVERVSPAVVSLDVVATVPDRPPVDMESLPPQWRRFFEGRPSVPGAEPDAGEEPQEGQRNRRARGNGSGFFISADGFIVTNHHVIENASEITATLQDGRELRARVVGFDERTDLAVLKVEARGLAFVQFDTGARVRVGDWVIAIGSPFGLGGTATAGIVSALGRDVPNQPGSTANIADFIQIDAPINPGNSGGPTFDLGGRVIGVNTAIYSRFGGNVGIGFMVPAGIADRVTRELMTSGRVTYGWLGVSIGDLTGEMASSFGLGDARGAVVGGVNPGSPAARAGLRRGDMILALNGERLRSSSDLTRRIGQTRVGSTVRMEVANPAGQRRTVEVTIAARPDEQTLAQTATSPDGQNPGARPATGAPAAAAATPGQLGLSVIPLPAEARERLGVGAEDGGVLIAGVTRSSTAFDRGLRTGMAVIAVNGTTVRNAEEYNRAVAAARAAGRTAVTLDVRAQQGPGAFVAVPLDGDAPAAGAGSGASASPAPAPKRN